MTPSPQMLRQRCTLTRPAEVPDADRVPRPAAVTLATDVPCAVAPLSLAAASRLRDDRGTFDADAILYLGPDAPTLQPDDRADVDGYSTWQVAQLPAERAGRSGQVGHRAYPVTREA